MSSGAAELMYRRPRHRYFLSTTRFSSPGGDAPVEMPHSDWAAFTRTCALALCATMPHTPAPGSWRRVLQRFGVAGIFSCAMWSDLCLANATNGLDWSAGLARHGDRAHGNRAHGNRAHGNRAHGI